MTSFATPLISPKRKSASLRNEPKKKLKRRDDDDDCVPEGIKNISPSQRPMNTRGKSKIKKYQQNQVLSFKTFSKNTTPASAYALLKLFRLGYGIRFSDYQNILEQCQATFSKLPNVSTLSQPSNGSYTVVVGDLHGQFYDLYDNILAKFGLPVDDSNPDFISTGDSFLTSNGITGPFKDEIPELPLLFTSKVNYVFNGDFIDRGSFSVQTLCSLLVLALAFPNNVYLNRGNHESESCAFAYGYFDELSAKYPFSDAEKLKSLSTKMFSTLPLASVLPNYCFIVHGGVSAKTTTVDFIQSLKRLQSDDSLHRNVTNLLWSDPSDHGKQQRSSRGCGVKYGPPISREFVKSNNLYTIIRSHEFNEVGYDISQGHDNRVVTVFSAPNYHMEYSKAAVLVIVDPDSKVEVSGLIPLDLGWSEPLRVFVHQYDGANTPSEPQYFSVEKMLFLLESKSEDSF
ncbi:hypothetical protein RCL1_002552 [Eukaryota sp. TZLM3-RCL]